ncbi:MAG: hypothetical protein WC334_09630, partial [Kiritimatiellales bacterium]
PAKLTKPPPDVWNFPLEIYVKHSAKVERDRLAFGVRRLDDALKALSSQRTPYFPKTAVQNRDGRLFSAP